METLIPPTRKRNRTTEEEEFLPLSKKINNLHINQWQKDDISPLWANQNVTSPNFYAQHVSEQDCHTNQAQVLQNSTTYVGHVQQQDPSSSNAEEANWTIPSSYSPDLGLDENPFYYESNKVLFELYLQRLQREMY